MFLNRGYIFQVFLLFAQLAVSISTYSQFSFYRNYTVNEGLPSSKVYDMIQDSKGYIWFATENGVSRFDGYDFENFTAQDGLPANSTLKLYEDFKGRIWFLSFEGSISYYENDSIYPHELNGQIFDLNIRFFDNICIDSAENIYLNPYSKGEYMISNQNELINSIKCPVKLTRPKLVTLYARERKYGHTLAIIANQREVLENCILESDTGFIAEYVDIIKYASNHRHFLKLSDGPYLISYGPCLRQFANSQIETERMFENEIIGMFEDNYKNIWICEQFSCVNMFPNGDLNAEPIKFLNGNSVSKVLQIEDGGYWFSTTKDGVYYVPSLQFQHYGSNILGIENEIILSVFAEGIELFFSTENLGLYSYTLKEESLSKNINFSLEGRILSNVADILITGNNVLWLPSTNFLKYNKNGARDVNYILGANYGNEIFELTNGNVLINTAKGFSMHSPEKLLYRSEFKYGFDLRTFAVNETEDSIIWIGSIDGLYTITDGTIEKYDEMEPLLSKRISEIEKIKNELWIGTFDNGIAVLDSDTVRHINTNSGLSSNRIKVLFAENDSTIWIGTNFGLNKIQIANKTRNIKTVEIFSIWDGLPSNEISDIIKFNNLIWLGTDKGLVSFEPQTIKTNQEIPTLLFEEISTLEGDYDFEMQNAEFDFDNNDIEFKYKGISFTDPGNLNYAYMLEGTDKEWLNTINTSVRYADLKPGLYKFIVKAQNVSGLWSNEIFFNFKIRKHYSHTILFQSAVIIFILTIIVVIVVLILKSQKRRTELIRQSLFAEQKALRSQMNPHFIFNSLNSVQNFILEKDNMVAGLYLAKFSSLMRKILDNSKTNTISLKEEIETIKLYLNLEKLRFEEQFDYFLSIDESLNTDEIQIPTMIIQPYLENAIRHGLIPLKSRGLLNVYFKSREDNKLMIVIEDNGIGRAKSGEISKKRLMHKSTGMQNTENRIRLLNKLNKTNMKVTVIDLYNENNEAIGTRVELFI